jgi:hypothetical protein
MKDEIRLIGGEVLIEVIRDTPEGPKVIHSQVNKNLIVNVGKKRLWKMAIGTTTKQFRFWRLGKNSAAAGSGDTNVKTALATANIRTVDSRTVDAGRTYKWVVSYPSGGGSLSAPAIKEVVLMDAKTTPGGSILMRTLVSPTVSKTTADKVRFTYKARIT